jgi:hypothetical protein
MTNNNSKKQQVRFSRRLRRHSGRVWKCQKCLDLEIGCKDSPIKIKTPNKKKLLRTPRKSLMDIFVEPPQMNENNEDIDVFLVSDGEQEDNESDDENNNNCYNRLINYNPCI